MTNQIKEEGGKRREGEERGERERERERERLP